MGKWSEFLFNNFVQHLPLLTNKDNEKYLNQIYRDILINYRISRKYKLKLMHKNERISNKKNIPVSNLLSSSYFSKDILTHINSKSKSYSLYNVTINNVKIKIYVLYFNTRKSLKCIDMILTLLSMLLKMP